MIITAADQALELLDAMDVLFCEAKAFEECRAELRIPFLRPVSITLNGDKTQRVSALSRDLSPMGIGLLHQKPLEPGDVILTIPTEHQELLHLRARIRWCQPCGEEWYMSGGQFLEVVPSPDDGEIAI